MITLSRFCAPHPHFAPAPHSSHRSLIFLRLFFFFSFSLFLFLFLTVSAFAAGSVVLASVERFPNSTSTTQVVLSYTCTSDASDGTLPAKTITSSDIGFNYYSQGFYLIDARAVNPAANYPTASQAITLTDSDGFQLIGSTGGDTLAHSTSASGVGYFSTTRDPSQREVIRALTIGAIGSSVGNSKVYTLRLVLAK